MGVKIFNPGLLSMFVLFSLSISAQERAYTLSKDSLVNYFASQKRVYYATRTETRPKIDGRLTDKCWQLGEWAGGFRQQQPNQAQPPSEKTEFKILYDDQNLYVAIRCYDDQPGKMRPILSRRDEVNSGDIAGIAFDTYHDKRTAFEFNVSAAGQKVDLMHLGAYQWDTNWDAVWDGKAYVGDSMWTSEMKIPFNQLRFARKDEQIWGMHVWRWIDRYNEEDQWKLIPIDAPAMVYIFGELRGIKGIEPKTHFELLPYTSAKYITEANNNQRFQFGLDGKISITSDFTLDYTFNPDFGQVEADPSVLNLTSYEVFYDEKRPFFLEGNSILEYDLGNDLLFYSRRIGHAPSYEPSVTNNQKLCMPDNTSILDALKLTGKSKNGFSLGVINSMTSKEFATITDPTGEPNKIREAVEPFTDYFIGRVKQDYNEGNTVIGGMVTSTQRSIQDNHLEFLPARSLVGGLNFQHNWANRKYYVDLKSFYSNIYGSTAAITRLQISPVHLYNRVDATYLKLDTARTNLSGWGGQLMGGKQSGKFQVTGTLNWRSPGVDLNDVGYLKQADYVREAVSMKYQVDKPRGILRNYYITMGQTQDRNFGGENIYNRLNTHAYLKFTNLWISHFLLYRYFNVLDTRQLRGGPALRIDDMTSLECSVQTNSARDLLLGVRSVWDMYDHNISNSKNYTFYIEWQIRNNLSVTSETVYDYTFDNSQYVGQKAVNDETRYIVGRIDRKTLYTTLRLEYFITPELSMQWYANPYASTGKYLDLRKVTSAQSKNVAKRFSLLDIIKKEDGKLNLDENNDGISDFSIPVPDFNFQEFNLNFVARWEFRPGSTIYLVWTHSQSKYDDVYNNSILDSFNGIFHVKSQNALMLKFSYWFSL